MNVHFYFQYEDFLQIQTEVILNMVIMYWNVSCSFLLDFVNILIFMSLIVL